MIGMVLWLALVQATSAAAPAGVRIAVQPGVAISADEPHARHVESVLAVNPKNARNLVAASMVLDDNGGIRVYTSRDGGGTWAAGSRADVASAVFPGIDPDVTFDSDGNAYLATLSKVVQVWKSTDGGKTWSGGAAVPASGDRPFIRCLPAESDVRPPRVLVSSKYGLMISERPAAAWAAEHDIVSLSMSSDGGRSFGSPRFLLLPPERELLNVVGDLLVTPAGRPMLVLQTFGRDLDLLAPVLTASYSTMTWRPEGGFSPPRPIARWHSYGHSNEGKSLFGLGFARVAIDRAGRSESRGRLFATWLDAVEGFYRVMAAYSEDEGQTWSAPIRVDDGSSATDASNPAIAVDGRGIVAITWNDRRGDPTERCYQTYFAASADAGASFSANRLIDRGFTCPIGRPGPSAAPDTTVDAVSSEYRFKNGGDTQGLVGLPEGGFHLAWINGASGEMQLWSTVVRVDRVAPSLASRR